MIDDLAAQFAQMQKYTATLHNLMTAAQAQAPRQSTGADKTGAVQITLGPDGLPKSFRVDNSWDRRIQPAEFGSAVMEAFQVAINDRMQAWTQALADDGWQDRVDALKTGKAPESRVPAAFRKPVPEVTPRPLGDVAEDMFKAFDNVEAFAGTPQTETGGSGSDRTGKLTLTVSATGLTSCTADTRWAAEQTAARLMNALSEALAAAKENLTRQASKVQPAGGLDGLFAEAMALLNNPGRLA